MGKALGRPKRRAKIVPSETSIARIKGLLTDEREPRPVLLLGAGASVKSGIPLAADLVDQIARWGYCRAHNRDLRDQSIERSDWVQWLRTIDWYEDDLPLETRYPLFVSRLLQPREDRKRFFQETVRIRMQPSRGYVDLADLVGKGWIRTLLTTNFDDLIVQACRGNVDAALITEIKSPELASLISSDPVDPQVIYLHGAVEYYTDCNLQHETEHLAADYISGLAPLLRDHPLIVLGYRGAEPSVMRDLLLDGADRAGGYRHGVFWCTRQEASALHPNVHQLAGKLGDNFLLVQIEDFDQALSELNQGVDRSARAPVRISTSDAATPDLQMSEGTTDDLDWDLVQRRLPVAASRLAIDLPERLSKEWLQATLIRLRLAVREDEGVRLTRAGEFLFSKNKPSSADLTLHGRRKRYEGNLCELMDELSSALTEINEPFRLKGPVSEEVRPYPPLALKELIVNALVHRDHAQPAPLRISLSDEVLTIISPGAVVSTVDPSQLGRVAVRGYRNPVIAGFFYGTGDMDKEGSGLVDVRRWAEEIGGRATYTSDDSPPRFEAVLRPRPERPDSLGRVAEPLDGFEVFHVNALAVRLPSDVVSVGPSRAGFRQEVLERHRGQQTAPFAIHSGELITLSDLTDESNPLVSDLYSPARQVDLADFCSDPDDERIVVGLLNESIRRHAKALGLRVFPRDQRLYFPRAPEGERKITYRGRVRDARRTVAKARVSSATGKVIYWEHHAVRWRFRRFGSDWFLFLVPGWVFTRDGEEELLAPRRITSLSTRRAARDYNQQVRSHLFFWSAILVGDERSRLLIDGSQAVLLERDPLSTQVVGAPPTPGIERDEDRDAIELEDVDEELIHLAESKDEGEDEEVSKSPAPVHPQ
jgi:hypothetical protein